jgi:hypothetical protein
MYRNTHTDRAKIMEEIKRLIAQGYKRKDIANERVEMSKIILKGKKCFEESVISFVFNRNEQTIEKIETSRFGGINEAVGMLFGWSSPRIEIGNAVKAGLLDKQDEQILRKHYKDKEWDKIL